LFEIIYLFTLSVKNFYIICKFVKIDHAEAWTKPTIFRLFQELRTRPLAEYFKPINITLGNCFYCSVPAKQWK